MRAKRRLYLRKYKHLWREKRFLDGICQECSSPVFRDRTRCINHLRARAFSQLLYRRRAKNGSQSSDCQ